MLSLHSQVAKLTGAIENNNSSVDKLAGKVRSIHGHVAAQDEAFFKWIEKVERLITDSWRSQGRNRSSIDDYNKLLKEISKELNTKLDAIRAAEVGARFQSGIPRPEPNWMYPGHGATGSSNPQPNFTAMPTSGFAAYGYQNREPQPFYQHPHPEVREIPNNWQILNYPFFRNALSAEVDISPKNARHTESGTSDVAS